MVSIHEETALELLEQDLTRGLEAAADRDKPTLVSAAIPVRNADPLAVFASVSDSERAFWEQPDRRFAWAALGSTARIEGSGAGRFEEASIAWQRLAQSAITPHVGSCPVVLPTAVGGFAFQAAARGSAWAAYPDALLVIPRFLFVRHGDSTWLAASILTVPETQRIDVEQIIRDAHHLLQAGSNAARAGQFSGALACSDGSDKESWKATVSEVLRIIARDEVRKLVLARQVSVRAREAIDAVAALARLRSRYQACTIFAFAQGDSCFLGATPERLVQLSGRTVRVDCLAGSAPRGADENEDSGYATELAADAKERNEHTFVVSAIQEALAPMTETLTIPTQPSIMKMPNVQHLHTPVEGTLRGNAGIIDLAGRLHPTPAACGVPRQAASELIRKHELFDRGWYAGPVGWVDSEGSGEFVVAIRSALLCEREALLYAGCGIVAGSNPNREYEESCLKLEPMLWAMNGESS